MYFCENQPPYSVEIDTQSGSRGGGGGLINIKARVSCQDFETWLKLTENII